MQRIRGRDPSTSRRDSVARAGCGTDRRAARSPSRARGSASGDDDPARTSPPSPWRRARGRTQTCPARCRSAETADPACGRCLRRAASRSSTSRSRRRISACRMGSGATQVGVECERRRRRSRSMSDGAARSSQVFTALPSTGLAPYRHTTFRPYARRVTGYERRCSAYSRRRPRMEPHRSRSAA